MKLLFLPSELLLTIAEDLSPKDVNSLLQTSRYLGSLLTPLLHKLALQDKDGMSALTWAATNGHEPLARLVLSKGNPTDIDAQDDTKLGLTALHCAANKGHKAIVLLLLQNGASVDIHDKFDGTPLIWCSYGAADLAQVLLDHGADINAQTVLRTTRLHRAVWENDVAMVRMLLENKANILTGGQTVFDSRGVARRAGMIEVFLELGSARDRRSRKCLLEWADKIGWGGIARTRYKLDEGAVDALVKNPGTRS
ncbi:hypothetical protein Q9L58_008432 [Maublancomyces gigas]|uniref:F-box domain-containing protein n=1 Tax=Discina gigas TaxID=1032678 RepID=A0ABR3G9X8_9PEZI